MDRRLRLSPNDKMIAGVCGGLAEYFRVDPTLVRVAFAVLAFVTAFAPVFILYVICWAVMPLDDAPRQ